MADALTRTEIPAKTQLTYNGGANLVAGEKLKIDAPIKIFEDTVPAGKKWGVTIKIIVYETDA